MERITATYYIKIPYSIGKAAEVLAGEQSSGTFVPVPGETKELKQRFAAKVEHIQSLGTADKPSLPGDEGKDGKYCRGIIKVSWSIENFGYNLPVLISTLQGNLYELQQFTGLKLMDIDLPSSFGTHYKGPSFGVDGCRQLTGLLLRRTLHRSVILLYNLYIPSCSLCAPWCPLCSFSSMCLGGAKNTKENEEHKVISCEE